MHRPAHPLFFAFLYCIAVLAGCKKGDGGTTEKLPCDLYHSRIKSGTFTDDLRSQTYAYTYDAQGRLTDSGRIVYNAAGDTAVESIFQISKLYYVFKNGMHVLTKGVSWNSSGDTSMTALTVYEYDPDHRLVKSYRNEYQYNYMYGTLQNISRYLADSTSYRWADGNLMEAKDLTGNGSSTVYDYDTSLNGWSAINVPLTTTRWINDPNIYCVPSKNMCTSAISTSSNGPGRTTNRFEYSVDDAGRIITANTYTNGAFSNRRTFTYECH